MLGASHGGVTHFCFCPTDDDEGIMTIGNLFAFTMAPPISAYKIWSAWGQGANNYELGLGDGQPKSATKPVEVQPLTGINIFESVAINISESFTVAYLPAIRSLFPASLPGPTQPSSLLLQTIS